MSCVAFGRRVRAVREEDVPVLPFGPGLAWPGRAWPCRRDATRRGGGWGDASFGGGRQERTHARSDDATGGPQGTHAMPRHVTPRHGPACARLVYI